jgi:glycosyltransferase involved in cell wall biosynthesis
MPFWTAHRCCWIATVGAESGVIAHFLFFCRALASMLAQLPSANLLHVHTSSRHSFFRKAPFVVLGRLLGKPVILHVHGGAFGDFWRSAGGFKRCLIASVLHSAAVVVAISQISAAELRAYLPDIRLIVVPNPYEQLPKVNVPEATGGSVLFVGRIDSNKGIFDLLHAFARTAQALPLARLVVAGDGKLTEARRLTAELGISGLVSFKGWITSSELATEFACATVFCLPTYCENLPMSLLLAMAAGVPVVSTPVGGIRELIETESSGMLVPPGDVAALSNALERMLLNAGLRRRLACSARDHVAAYSPTAVNALMENLYSSLQR